MIDDVQRCDVAMIDYKKHWLIAMIDECWRCAMIDDMQWLSVSNIDTSQRCDYAMIEW